MMPRKSNRGFSLIEVLVALVIVALVIGAATQVVGQSIRNTTALKESTFARWVALNQLELYRMQSETAGAPLGNDEGNEEMGNMQWHWVREVGTSSADAILEVKVSVYVVGDRAEEEPVVSVKGYVAAP